MARNVQLVLLCEDTQQESFVRRFLKKSGWNMRRLRVEKAPRGGGSAEQFVREQFPEELRAYRAHRKRVAEALVVIIDGDEKGVQGRLQELDAACNARGVPVRSRNDKVMILVPTRSIETWLAYLDGNTVNETAAYPKLPRESDCQRHVDCLYEMCRQGKLKDPAPPSLEAACEEYRSRF